MRSDVLTKEMKMLSGLEATLLDNLLELPDDKINIVCVVDGEIHLANIRNRKIILPEE